MSQNLEQLEFSFPRPVTATFSEVAKRYGVAIPTIYRWINTLPDFPKPRKIGPNTTRFLVAELDAYDQARPLAV